MVSKNNDYIIIPKKKSTITSKTGLGFVVKETLRSYRLFFKSVPAVLTLIGVFFRLWETAIVSNYQPKYYGVYSS